MTTTEPLLSDVHVYRVVPQKRLSLAGFAILAFSRHTTILSHHSPGGSEERNKNLTQDNLCPGRHSNCEPTESKSETLPF
jgi:hypothetical protein